MRLILPNDISNLAKTISPYMVFNEENELYELREDAPKEVKEAKKKYDEWWSENYRRDYH